MALPRSEGGASLALVSGPLSARVAFDISAMVRNQLGGPAQVMTYLTDLVAAHSARLQAEIPMTLQLGDVQIWTDATMPYNPSESNYEELLVALENYWNANFTLIPRDLVMMLWKPNNRGGVAEIASACEPNFDYGLTDVVVGGPYQNGSFGHELGHILGAGHSHCLAPPADYCGNDYGACRRLCIGGTRAGLACTYAADCPGGTCNTQTTCAQALNNGTPCLSAQDCPKCHQQPLQDITTPPGGSLMSYCSLRRFEYGVPSAAEIQAYVNTLYAACLRPTEFTTPVMEADTWALALNPDNNYGASTSAESGRVASTKGSTPYLARAFLAIDLDNYIPSVTSYPVRAVLKLHVNSVVTDPGLPTPRFLVRRATGAFDEATLTWNNAPTLSGSATGVVWTPPTSGMAEINVTTLVQECWNNYGADCFWGIRAENEVDNTNGRVTFRTSEDPTVSTRPVLEIEYAP